jgi:hypothetical protein
VAVRTPMRSPLSRALGRTGERFVGSKTDG